VLVGADSVYVSDVVYRSEDSVFTVLVGGLERLCVVYQSEDSVFTKIIFFFNFRIVARIVAGCVDLSHINQEI